MRQQFSMTIPMEYVISNNRASPIWLRRLFAAFLLYGGVRYLL